jgi:hypothetical protein
MTKSLPSNEPLKIGFYQKCLRFFRTHRMLRHALAISGFAISCVGLGYIAITYFEISKEAVWGGIILLFTALLTIYFAKQPKAE